MSGLGKLCVTGRCGPCGVAVRKKGDAVHRALCGGHAGYVHWDSSVTMNYVQWGRVRLATVGQISWWT